MRRTPIISALIALVAIAAVLAPAAMASGGGTTRTIALHGSVSFPNATGKAVYKVNGSERELQIEVEHIKVLAGKHVNVFVNGNKLGQPAGKQPRHRPRQPQHRQGPVRPHHQERLDRARAHPRRHPDRKRHVLIAQPQEGGWSREALHPPVGVVRRPRQDEKTPPRSQRDACCAGRHKTAIASQIAVLAYTRRSGPRIASSQS